jgi:hypothetical protein
MKTMKKINFLYKTVVMILTIMVVSCDEETYEFGDVISPSNIQLTAVIEGADASNPTGDGSGKVHLSATADNAISFQYVYNDEVIASPSGSQTYLFGKVGVNIYTVTVIAVGTAGVTSSKSINLEVRSDFEDAEAKDYLSGGAGNSKTWYWAADKPANIGLGPNTVQAGGEHTWSQWFTSSAWHEDKLCMYDAEMVFTQAANGDLTYEQTVGDAYLPGDYAGSIGVDGNTCHGTDVVPSITGVKNVTLTPSSSIATVDGDYRGTTINFSNGGFMSWYVANSSFEIIEITATTLFVRVEEGPRAWYCLYQTEKPVQ